MNLQNFCFLLYLKYAVCNWHRHMTCLKLALSGSKKDPERSLVVQDHCTMMHRFDKRHVTYFRIIRCDDPSLTQQTIQDYLSSDAGAIWDDADTCALVQHYIRNLALLRLAKFTNTERLQKEMEFLSTDKTLIYRSVSTSIVSNMLRS